VAALEGRWQMIDFERDGKKGPLSGVVIKGNKFTIEMPDGKRRTSTFRIDPTKRPKWFDDAPEGSKPWPGIYERNDDVLKICFDSSGVLKRPSEFKTSPASGLALFVLKREAPAGHDARLPTSLIGQGAVALGTGTLPLEQLVDVWSEPPYATIGLGTGTMAKYGRPLQHMTFYEIDKNARQGNEISIVMGDSRIQATTPGIDGVLRAVDKNTVTVHIPALHLTAERVPVATDAKILVAGAPAKLADLAPGMPVTLHMSAAREESLVVAITAEKGKKE